jgi:hypothetical protein
MGKEAVAYLVVVERGRIRWAFGFADRGEGAQKKCGFDRFFRGWKLRFRPNHSAIRLFEDAPVRLLERVRSV